MFQTSDGNIMCNIWQGHVNESFAGQFFKIKPDGTKDEDFRFTQYVADQSAWIGELPDQKYFAAGIFLDPLNGDTLPNLIRLMPDGSVDPDFNSDLNLFYLVQDVEQLSNGNIWVSGYRRDHPGATLADLAILDPEGKMLDFLPFNFENSVVTGITEQGQDSILLWGYLNLDNQYYGAIRIDQEGNIDPTFNLEFPTYNLVRDLRIRDDGKILTAGKNFRVHNENGAMIQNVGLPWEIEHFSIADNGNMIFTSSKGVFRLENGLARPMQNRFNGSPSASCYLPDGSFLVAGYFTRFDDHFQPGIVNLVDDGSNITFNPDFELRFEKPGFVKTFTNGDNNTIWMGGDFLYVNGQYSPNLCHLNRNGQIVSGFDLHQKGEVKPIEKLITLSNGNILAAGKFDRNELSNDTIFHGLTMISPAEGFVNWRHFEFGYTTNPCSNGASYAQEDAVLWVDETNDGKILALGKNFGGAARDNRPILNRSNTDGSLGC
ncbi:MAG: delta-60 repeat domain-containing protein [Saprospiraceae bacterium]